MTRFKAIDPRWEAAKATCRNLSHEDAVQEVCYLQDQYRLLWGGPMVSSPVDLRLVLHTLHTRKVPFVLTGTHGLSGWMGRPRATQDMDILVKGGRNHARAVTTIKALYPTLEVRRFTGVTAFFLPGEKESVIDIVSPHRPDLEETLAHPVWVENEALELRYRIPSLEAALANKYGAMLTSTRDVQKRAMDAADFGWMVKHSLDEGRQPIDLNKLAFLGALVWPEGGAEEIVHFVEQVKSGIPIDLGSAGRPG